MKNLLVLVIMIFFLTTQESVMAASDNGDSDSMDLYELYIECVDGKLKSHMRLEQAETECRYILDEGDGDMYRGGYRRAIDSSIENLNNILLANNYRLVATSAIMGTTLWSLLKSPALYKQFLLRRAHPAFAIVPPEVLESFLEAPESTIGVAPFKEYTLVDLKAFLKLSKTEQYQYLTENPDFLAYLFLANKSVEEQKFWILYRRGEAA